MQTYLPEGALISSEQNRHYLKTPATLQEAIVQHSPVEARALLCDSGHNLIVDLGCMKGVIPREDCALGIREGTAKDIAILSRVNKPVAFYVVSLEQGPDGEPFALLDRRQLQEDCRREYLSALKPGDVIPARVTHLEPFGCFADIGCGVVSLLPIDSISVSRISHPRDRFRVGQDIFCVVRSIDQEGKICLTHKELLGSWEQNARRFSPGETVAGIVRSVEPYGVFVELTPNLAGLAELREDVRPGQHASVYIKSLLPEKMKVKLILVDSFQADYPPMEYRYTQTSGHISRFVYSPEHAEKLIETVFDNGC